MYYVYSRYIGNGREDYIGQYPEEKDAVIKIAQCYAIDTRLNQRGEYYYFMKRH